MTRHRKVGLCSADTTQALMAVNGAGVIIKVRGGRNATIEALALQRVVRAAGEMPAHQKDASLSGDMKAHQNI